MLKNTLILSLLLVVVAQVSVIRGVNEQLNKISSQKEALVETISVPGEVTDSVALYLSRLDAARRNPSTPLAVRGFKSIQIKIDQVTTSAILPTSVKESCKKVDEKLSYSLTVPQTMWKQMTLEQKDLIVQTALDRCVFDPSIEKAPIQEAKGMVI